MTVERLDDHFGSHVPLPCLCRASTVLTSGPHHV